MYIHKYIHMHTYVTYTRTTYRHVSIHICPTARLQRAAPAGLIAMRYMTRRIAMRYKTRLIAMCWMCIAMCCMWQEA